MSIATGEPQGRVVFIDDLRMDCVVIERARVEHLEIVGPSSHLIWFHVSGRAEVLRACLETSELALAAYHSVVYEDRDVIWTRSRETGLWTRTPDLPEGAR